MIVHSFPCVVSTKQVQRLQALRLGGRNATMMSSKWKCSYGSGRKYKSEWEITCVWVQKAVCGSVCNMWHHCTQSVPSREP